jgi:hypothetical protein
MSRLTAFATVLAAAAIASASGAVAQNASSAREACRSSVMTLCPDEVKAMDRPAIRACLIKNFDKATPECQAAMKAMASKEPPAPAPAGH